MYKQFRHRQIIYILIIMVIFLFLGAGSADAWDHFQGSQQSEEGNTSSRQASSENVTKNNSSNSKSTQLASQPANSHWIKGNPPMLRTSGSWISSPLKHGRGFIRNATGLGGNYGINPAPFFFSASHHFKNNGNVSSADMAVHPHYKSLGHGKYKIESGGKGDHVYSTLKIFNSHTIAIWCGHQYLGVLHRVNHATFHHFINHPYF